MGLRLRSEVIGIAGEGAAPTATLGWLVVVYTGSDRPRREELTHALEAPVWERSGTFTGHPHIVGTVTRIAAERCVVIAGEHGNQLTLWPRFETVAS